MPGSIWKAQIRNRVWDLLRERAISRSPGIYGCTPEFRGTSRNVEQLRRTSAWRDAQRVLVLGEPVLGRVREAVLEDGKLLLVPDLCRAEPGWVVAIDGQAMSPADALEAAREAGRDRPLPTGARYLRGREVPGADLMVIGAVAVTRDGNRVGNGSGEADLVYALGRDRGFLGARTPVAVVLHRLQVLDEHAEREPTDLPIDLLITPDECLPVDAILMRPKGLHPCMITAQRLRNFPGLREILKREGIAVPECQG